MEEQTHTLPELWKTKIKAESIEETLNELSVLLATMEKEPMTLEESFEAYERGMKLIKACEESVMKIQKRIEVLEQQYDEF